MTAKIGAFTILWISLFGGFNAIAQDTLVHGYVVDRTNKAVPHSVVLPYRFIDMPGGTVGSSHPAGAGYFAPPGDEYSGWYLFHIHLPNSTQKRLVGPIYVGPQTQAVVLPIDGRPAYYGYVRNGDEDPMPSSEPYFAGRVAGVNYCGFFDFQFTDEPTEGVQGYVVDHGNIPVIGATVYPYRYIGFDAWAVPGHPMGDAYFSADVRLAGWYVFNIQPPNSGALVQTEPLYVGGGNDPDTLVLSTDGRAPFYGNPYAGPSFPSWSRDGTYARGAVMFPDADGKGIFFGVGEYEVIGDRLRFPTTQSLHDLVCNLSGLGINTFRAFATGGPWFPDAQGKTHKYYVSPYKNTSEWISRRDALLRAALDCKVYVQFSLFDEITRNDSHPDPEWTRSDNAWWGRDATLTNARDFASNYLLKGLNPSQGIGQVLLVEDMNEPPGDLNEWSPEESRDMTNWLKQLGWKTASGGKRGDAKTYGNPDKLELHLHRPSGGQTWNGYFDQIIGEALEFRTLAGRIPAISSDGTPTGEIPKTSIERLITKAIQNKISFEMLVSPDDGLDLSKLDQVVRRSGAYYNGWTTRQYIEHLVDTARSAAGM